MDIYGQVGGLSHADKNGRDCSKPCMFLHGFGCKLTGLDAVCVAAQEPAAEARKEEREPRPWTDEELEAVRTMPASKAAIKTGRTSNEVTYMRRKLGVRGKAIRPWTDAEVALMLGNHDNAAVGKMIGRTKDAVKNKRHKLAKKGVFLV